MKIFSTKERVNIPRGVSIKTSTVQTFVGLQIKLLLIIAGSRICKHLVEACVNAASFGNRAYYQICKSYVHGIMKMRI